MLIMIVFLLQEKKMRFEAEVKEIIDDEVKSVKWDGGDLKVKIIFSIVSC